MENPTVPCTFINKGYVIPIAIIRNKGDGPIGHYTQFQNGVDLLTLC